MKKRLVIFSILALSTAASAAFAGTVTGTLQGPNGLTIKNASLNFNLEQAGLILGTGAVVPLTASCYTSINGAVVGTPNPTANVLSSVNYGSGSLPGGIYYVETTFYIGSQETLPSPELRLQLSSAGTLVISPPISFPASATGMRVYIGTSSGTETLQGQTTDSTAQYSQATALAVGTAPPATNTSVCSIAFNDTIIPYSGYNVSLISSSGNAYPGWPQAWQLNGGLNGTVNISQGAPLWNGVIVYPQPIVAQPLNNGPQSIAGNLNMSGYNIVNVGSLGVGTVTPSWPIDVENGGINASGGYLFNGAAPVNHVLLGNGSYYVDSATIPASIISGMGDNYQTAQSNGAAQPQEPAYNFSTAFALSDNSGAATNVGLANSGVTAGTFTNPTLTVGADGRVTSATSEAAIPTIQKLQVTTGICSTANTVSYSSCSFAATWPVAFADANYAVTCTARTPNVPGLTAIWTEAETAAGFNIYLQNGTSNGAVAVTVAEVDCIGVHP